MSHFTDAKQLVEYCKPMLEKIGQEYDNSLHSQTVRPSLLIDIKNFMENLRSALDFSAHGLFDMYGDKTKNSNIYFPYAWAGLSKADFIAKNIIEQKIPGITSSRPDIVAKIENYQYFANSANEWLPKFMDLNNENKHQHLTPQVRKEVKQLKLSSNGTAISLGGGARISLGSGARIQMGGMTIFGGQSFDADNPPITAGQGTKEIITWVSFHFSNNNESVLPLLKSALDGVETIVEELTSL